MYCSCSKELLMTFLLYMILVIYACTILLMLCMSAMCVCSVTSLSKANVSQGRHINRL